MVFEDVGETPLCRSLRARQVRLNMAITLVPSYCCYFIAAKKENHLYSGKGNVTRFGKISVKKDINVEPCFVEKIRKEQMRAEQMPGLKRERNGKERGG